MPLELEEQSQEQKGRGRQNEQPVLQQGFDTDRIQPPHLTRQETQVLRALARALSQKQIAGEMEIAIATVGGYKKRLREKFRAPNDVGIVIAAIRAGVVQVPGIEPANSNPEVPRSGSTLV